jgi:hypothetical protein
MQRRHFNFASSSVLASLILTAYQQAHALSSGDLAGISDKDASAGLKTALEQGALAAVALLGKKSLGQGKRIDELLLSINRAAEAAVPMGKDLLVSSVRAMSVTDAKNILTGGEASVTAFFAEKTRTPLSGAFMPIVTRATEKVGLANQYNDIAGKAAGFGLVKKEDANIQQYVTGKSLDGLYLIIGEEEKKIRQDPAGTGSAILKKVFGALR